MLLLNGRYRVELILCFCVFHALGLLFRLHWSETFDKVDPIFQNDIGFYLFRLPFIETIQNSLIVLVAVVTIGLFFIYLNTESVSFD